MATNNVVIATDNSGLRQHDPVVTAVGGGFSVAAWSSNLESGEMTIGFRVLGSSGEPVGIENRVLDQGADESNPSVVSLGASANGYKFAIIYEGWSADWVPGILGTIYELNSATQTISLVKQFEVDTNPSNDATYPAAVVANGRIVVAWHQVEGLYAGQASDPRIAVRTFDLNGNNGSGTTYISDPDDNSWGYNTALSANDDVVTIEWKQANPYINSFTVNTNGTLSNVSPNNSGDGIKEFGPGVGEPWSSTVLDNGNILQLYSDSNTDTLYAREIIGSPPFTEVRSPFAVNTSISEYGPVSASATTLPGGGYMIVWARAVDAQNIRLFARLFDDDGVARTNEFLVSDGTTFGKASHPQIACGPDGGVVIVWESDTTNNSTEDNDIVSRLFENIGPTALGTPIQLAAIQEDVTSPIGVTIGSLVSGQYDDQDQHALAGVAVVGNASSSGSGVWQYSTNGGASWLSLTTNVSDTNATILTATTLVRFLPTPNFNGSPESISVRLWDGQGGFSTGQGRNISGSIFDASDLSGNSLTGAFTGKTIAVAINVTPVNDAPTAQDKTVSLLEDGSYSFSAADFGFSDTEGDDLAEIVITHLPQNGTLSWNGHPVSVNQTIAAADIGQLKFEPAPDANGSGYAAFQFQVRDTGGTANGGQDTSAEHTLTIDVTPVNDAPAAQDETISLLEDDHYTFSAADFGFSDPVDGNSFTAIEIVSLPEEGILTLLSFPTPGPVAQGAVIAASNLDMGKLGYTPPANGSGAGLAGFSFRVKDFGGTDNGGVDTSDIHHINLDVTPVNDAASFGGTNAGVVTEDNILAASGVLTVSDIDTGEAGFQAQADVRGAYGIFSFDHLTGGWAYVLDNTSTAVQALGEGEVKQETFTVQSTDGTEQIVTVSVHGAKDADAIDGVVVSRNVVDNGNGTSSQIVTIPVVTAGRDETDGSATYADIPLVSLGGRNLLTVQLGIGIGLTATGFASPKAAGSSLADLIHEIQAHTAAGSFDQDSMIGGGSGFLAGLPTDRLLVIQSITPTQAGTASGVPLVISGSSDPNDPATALVIDARGLPDGTVIALENVAFATVIGNVRLTGGAGSQVVYGDGASQHMVLGADDDTLHGGAGNDYVGSHGGNDWLYGDAGSDTVSGGTGSDHLFGGSGNDRLLGGSGNDRLDGGSGADTLSGGTGADRLTGNSGNDTLKGDSGNDWVVGGLGRDKLYGGAGADLFDFNSVQESRVGAQRDIVYDFQSGRDRIDLRGIDANELRKGNQAFSWTAKDGPFLYPKETAAFLAAGFTGKAGQLRYDHGILMGDTDGDGKADFQIKIVGHFSVGDVLL